MNLLDDLQVLVDDLNTTNSRNDKIEIVKKYPHLQAIINYIYDPYKKFNVTSKTCLKFRSKPKKASPLGKFMKKPTQSTMLPQVVNDVDFFEMLDTLVSGHLSGHSALSAINDVVKSFPEHEELIYRIIDKDIKCRIGSKDINKAFPKLIPQFEVALADHYKDKNIKLVDDTWFMSRKLDGVRCVAVLDGKVTLYSRQGNEFSTLQKIVDLLIPIKDTNIVLDGEICVIKEDDSDDFKGVMKEITRKNHEMSNPIYLVFDCLTLADFNSLSSKMVFSERIEAAGRVVEEIDNDRIQLLEQIPFEAELFEKMRLEADEIGWEGLILRKNCDYKGKRSKDILKVKTFFDAEFTISSLEMSTKQVIREGKNITVPTLGSAIIDIIKDDVKVSECGVGSGWTESERIYYHANPEELLGKVITVRYKQESCDENGKPSLQFPVIKVVHGKERIT